MQDLGNILTTWPEWDTALSLLSDRRTVAVGGLSPVHKAHVIATLLETAGRPVVLLCPDELDAAQLLSDVAGFCGIAGELLPLREFTFRPVTAVSREWDHQRLSVLYRMAMGDSRLTAGPADAFLQRTLPAEALRSAAIHLSPGLRLPPQELLSTLVGLGYTRCELVEGVGQFAQRGSIIDVYPTGQPYPVRIDYWDDEVDTLSPFDPSTQRRIDKLAALAILPAAETVPGLCRGGIDGLVAALETLNIHTETERERLRETLSLPSADRFLPLIHPKMSTALDYLSDDTIVVLSEGARLHERVESYIRLLNEDMVTLLANDLLTPALSPFALDADGLYTTLRDRAVLQLDLLPTGQPYFPPEARLTLTAKALPSYGGSLDMALHDLNTYREESYRTVLFSPSPVRCRHLHEILEGRGILAALHLPSEGKIDTVSNAEQSLNPLRIPLPTPGQVAILCGSLSGGLEYPALKLAVISEGQILTPRRKGGGRAAKKDPRTRIVSYTDLSDGDFVVHQSHGIGKFTGMVTREIDGVQRDYIRILYAGTDTLLVPVTQLHLVSKYIGAGEDAPVRLNKLGGGEWQRAKVKARAAAKELAAGLIRLYAERARRPGFAFPDDADWQAEFEEAFPFEETEDQLRCAREIKSDMRRPHPMDRLLCGDVGFGKTEVAFRAIMKCVLGGKQAAMLVPTTVLAGQHLQTAQRRFDRYPVRMEMLSRFRTPKQIKQALNKLKTGELDLIIGTHRLLQKDVEYHDLGLLIIDEEQRFGVSHKERIKEIARQVDVLTLTATPIPRTLNMALSGLRDMSTIEEAPRDRYPVQTFVLEHEWPVVADAVRREVGRGGQVYYLHNRVESIDSIATKLGNMLPGVTIATAHGQMQEAALSDIMNRMNDSEIQVLVCTTIIETGIDIPNVNTLIIEDADRFGLAQLHQIRGRVGRSTRHAYAYLTYRRGKVLSELASKRLAAIREFAEFGSGFKIAMRDLEIRGAGNVLGSEQHGMMMNVGYDMYLKLLEEAVLEERGESTRPLLECTADLNLPAKIPDRYITASGQRMDVYRRIGAVRDGEDASDLIDELCDRYGDIPDSVHTLIQIALLRAGAARLGIHEIAQRKVGLFFKMTEPELAMVSGLCAHPSYKRRVLFSAGEEPYFHLKLAPHEPILKAAQEFVEVLASFAPPEEVTKVDTNLEGVGVTSAEVSP